MKTKKGLAILLAVMMITSLFAGCGKKGEEKTGTNPTTPTTKDGDTTDTGEEPTELASKDPITFTSSGTAQLQFDVLAANDYKVPKTLAEYEKYIKDYMTANPQIDGMDTIGISLSASDGKYNRTYAGLPVTMRADQKAPSLADQGLTIGQGVGFHNYPWPGLISCVICPESEFEAKWQQLQDKMKSVGIEEANGMLTEIIQKQVEFWSQN